MTMFHQGTDAAAFEYVKVMSPKGKVYHCDFPIQLIDNEDYLSTIECQEGWLILKLRLSWYNDNWYILDKIAMKLFIFACGTGNQI